MQGLYPLPAPAFRAIKMSYLYLLYKQLILMNFLGLCLVSNLKTMRQFKKTALGP